MSTISVYYNSVHVDYPGGMVLSLSTILVYPQIIVHVPEVRPPERRGVLL